MGLETATKEIILVASLGVGIGGVLINSNHADENALNTCNAISQGINPEDAYYVPYYGFPRPAVDDERFGLIVEGGPIYRNSQNNRFQRWENARPEDAISISEFCNSRINISQIKGIGSVTADKVRKAILMKHARR